MALLGKSVCAHAKIFADPVAYVARIGLGDDRNAMSAFLFTFPGGDTSAPAEKLPKASTLLLLPCQKTSQSPKRSRSLLESLHWCDAGKERWRLLLPLGAASNKEAANCKLLCGV